MLTLSLIGRNDSSSALPLLVEDLAHLAPGGKTNPWLLIVVPTQQTIYPRLQQLLPQQLSSLFCTVLT